MDEHAFPDDVQTVLPFAEYVTERSGSLDITFRQMLELLKEYHDGLYAENAAQTLAGLDPDELDSIPEDIDDEEAPFCVVFYLPNHTLVRVLPGYGFELQTWEEVEDAEDPVPVFAGSPPRFDA
jgi:hypothetical protein